MSHSDTKNTLYERDIEFPQLKDSVYVDHSGATLYSKSQLEAFQRELLSNLYGNPHSRSQSSRLATDSVDQIRYRILAHFNTTSTEYSVIFTSGCTGALKLVAECFDFSDDIDIEPLNSYQKRNDERVTTLEKDKLLTSIDQPSMNRNLDESERNHYDTWGCKLKATEQGCELQSKMKVKSGCYAYLLDNHTSVQGIREVVKSRVKYMICVEEDSKENFKLHYLPGKLLNECDEKGQGNSYTEFSLFAYPAQSNFNGRKYPLHWIDKIHQGQMSFQWSTPGRWLVLLDAASYVSTSDLDLDQYKPDFITLSFYKMFGFPTGIGALLVRNRSALALKKNYFGGGTVEVSSPTELYHVHHPNIAERFEDGTVPFLDIIALRHGFDALENLGGGMKSISSRSFKVAKYFYNSLVGLRHSNDQPVAEIYCHGNFSSQSTQGPIVNFNLKRVNGTYIGFAEVDKMAQLYNIHLRTGCFCNIGLCQKYLNMSSEQIKTNFESGHVCGDDKDLINGRPTGSVRISFGYMSTIDDAKHCLKFICDCFVERDNKPDFSVKNDSKPDFSVKNDNKSDFCVKNDNKPDFSVKNDLSVETKSTVNTTDTGSESAEEPETKNFDSTDVKSKIYVKTSEVDTRKEENLKEQSDWTLVSPSDLHIVVQQCSLSNCILTSICLYPVKSCGAFEVNCWEVCETGLLYDREWMIVSESGVTISQKREPKLCLIKPQIDIANRLLKLSFQGVSHVRVSLDISGDDKQTTLPCVGKVCGDRISGMDCGDEVGQWISDVLQRPGCRLIRQDKTQARTCKLSESDKKTTLSLVNESQYLLITRKSVEELQHRILLQEDNCTFELENLIERFRANLVIGGGQPFDEDSWQDILIGNNIFMSQGGCSRCQMVCLDQVTGKRSKEPLRTLAAWRGRKIPFGIHLQHSASAIGGKIKVGDILKVQ